MTMLRPSDRDQLREHFAQKLSGDVTVSFFTQSSLLYLPGRECPYCRETGQILEEVSSLSEKLHLQVHDFYNQPERAAEMEIERIPAFVLEGGGARGRVRFFGIPAGNEFMTLVEGIVDVSTGGTSLSEESRRALASVTRDVHIQVFVTPT